jgi:hypothetical protein
MRWSRGVSGWRLGFSAGLGEKSNVILAMSWCLSSVGVLSQLVAPLPSQGVVGAILVAIEYDETTKGSLHW